MRTKLLTAENVLTVPLEGVSLVEASAGSGKTHMLAAIVLRWLLEGHPVESILAVTFTRAATEELRGRVRRMTAACLQAFDTGRPPEGDALLAAALERWCGPERGAAARRLEAALAAMDEAPIHTIHGFCQRLLREHAFAARGEFDPEILEDESEPLLAVARDLWRARVATLPPRELALVRAMWSGPEDMLAFARPYLARVPHVRRGSVEPAAGLGEALAAAAREARNLAAGGLEGLLEAMAAWAKGEGPYKEPGWQDEALHTLGAWLAGEAAGWPQALAAVSLRRHARKRGPSQAGVPDLEALVSHPLLTLGDRVLALEAAYGRAFAAEALCALREAWAAWRARKGVLSHDDLLTRVRDALARGAGGGRLAAELVRRWPVALVDEFQDTDPVQSAILGALAAAGQRQVLIGDPKQAIYAFRGADVFAYMKTYRTVPPERRYGLPHNWRSRPACVEAVNALFARPEAFLYDEIPFQPSAPAPGRTLPALRLPDADGGEAGLCIWRMPEPDPAPSGRPRYFWPPGEARQWAARCVAAHAAGLLAAARAGGARIGARALRGGDLAVLVFTHRQAQLVRRELGRCGVASAYVGSDSVWATEEAEELETLLAAVAAPGDARLLRRALASPLLGWDLARLARELGEPGRWEHWLERFALARERWERQGFMAAFHGLMRDLGLPAALAGRMGGERALTNLLHLAELVQEAAGSRHGVEDLLAWFVRSRRERRGGGEASLLRLESDADLVRIVTVHRAKGLQFPIVYLPFPWEPPAAPPPPPAAAVWHDDEGTLVLDLVEERPGRAARERLAEWVRLLYVALTRAELRTYLPWGPVGWPAGSASSPFAWLVHGRDVTARAIEETGEAVFLDRTAGEEIDHDLAELAARAGKAAVRVLPAPEAQDSAGPPAPVTPASSGPEAAPAVQTRPFRGAVRQHWRVTSYSQLAGGGGGVRDRDADPRQAVEGEPPPAAPADVHALPRGARLGNLLHLLLERLGPRIPDRTAAAEAVARLAPRFGLEAAHHGLIAEWLVRVSTTPLPTGFRLADLAPGHWLTELPFHFGACGLDLEALDRLLRRHGVAPLPRPLPFGAMTGLFAGQIDLVFRHEGRWYLADYKTTWLGPDAAAYAPERLGEAMRRHRYDLQCLIYAVALHRYLVRRVPEYRPGRDFGGALYLFLRGMDGPDGDGRGAHLVQPAPALVEALDRLLQGGGCDAG